MLGMAVLDAVETLRRVPFFAVLPAEELLVATAALLCRGLLISPTKCWRQKEPASPNRPWRFLLRASCDSVRPLCEHRNPTFDG